MGCITAGVDLFDFLGFFEDLMAIAIFKKIEIVKQLLRLIFKFIFINKTKIA